MDNRKDSQVSERRSFVRLNASSDVQYTVLERVPLDKIKVLSKNISAGGICLIVYEELAVDTILGLTIYFPDSSLPVVCKGRIVWSRAFKVANEEKKRFDAGIEFIEISDEDRKKIDQNIFHSISRNKKSL